MKLYALIILLFLLLAAGCGDHGIVGPEPSAVPDVRGVYILNEGNYGDVEGARVTFYAPDADTVYRSIVEITNSGAHLGSTADDIALFRGKLYILMSGSERLMVLAASDHQIKMVADYPGATPHSMLIDSARSCIYITQLYKNSLLVVDLQTLQVLDTIVVGMNPQDMALRNGRLFVCNSGYGADNTITVINPDTRNVVETLRVGAGPTGIVAGSDGRLWVACSGNAYAAQPLPGSVYMIDAATMAVGDSVVFAEPLGGTIAAAPGGYVYVIGSSTSYYGGPIHRIAVASKGVTLNFISGTFYGAGIDDQSGDLYVADTKNFTSSGEVSIYTEGGVLKKRFVAERGPSQFLFKR